MSAADIYQGTLFGQGELFADGAPVDPAPAARPAVFGYREPWCLHGSRGDTGECEPCILALVWGAEHASERGQLEADQAADDGHTCITASCLAHRRRVFWQPGELSWVHAEGAWRCYGSTGLAPTRRRVGGQS